VGRWGSSICTPRKGVKDGNPEQALAEYKGDLKFNPKRFDGLYGAAEAAEMAGLASQAGEYFAVLVKTCEGSGSSRSELAQAKQAVVAEK
jgi:hypothetical protein